MGRGRGRGAREIINSLELCSPPPFQSSPAGCSEGTPLYKPHTSFHFADRYQIKRYHPVDMVRNGERRQDLEELIV